VKQVPVSKFVQVGDVRLHFMDWESDKPPLLLLHGGRITGRSWDAVAPGLAEKFRVIQLDARGHGDSEITFRGYSYQQRAQDLETFLDSQGIDMAYGIGHSTGAVTMAVHAYTYPGRFSRIMLIEPPMRTSPRPGDERIRRRSPAAQKRAWKSRNELENYLRQHPRTRRWKDDALMAVVNYGARELPDGSVELKWTPNAYNQEERGQDDPKLVESASLIEVPVFLMYGTEGVAKPDDVNPFMVALPNCQIMWVQDSGHNVYMEEPDAVVKTAGEFFHGRS